LCKEYTQIDQITLCEILVNALNGVGLLVSGLYFCKSIDIIHDLVFDVLVQFIQPYICGYIDKFDGGDGQAFKGGGDQTVDGGIIVVLGGEHLRDVGEHEREYVHDRFDVVGVSQHAQHLFVGQEPEPVLGGPFQRYERLQ